MNVLCVSTVPLPFHTVQRGRGTVKTHKMFLKLWRKARANLDSILKNRGITLLTKVHLVKAMVFPVAMYGCESWTIKKAEQPRIVSFGTVVLEKTLKGPLNYKEIQPVNAKGNQSWIFIGRSDAKAEAPILWPPDAKNWHIGKIPNAGKDRRQEEKGMTEDEMVGWHHWLNRHQFEQDPGICIGQGSLACCSLWGHKESGTEWLNCLSEWLFPPLSLSLWAFLFLDTHNIEFRPVNKPPMPFKC